VMKLDLIAHVKTNALLMQKLESAFASHMKIGTGSNVGQGTKASEGGAGLSNNNRASTPPMQSLAKANMKIRIGKGEIEQKKGQAPQVVNF